MEHYTCEIIPSIRGNPTINVHGFIMIKDKNRRDLYYWCCEKRDTFDCGGHATTILVGGEHILRQAGGHNHAADASRAGVRKLTNQIKEHAKQTLSPPSQIIQSVIANNPQNIYPYIPSYNALCQTIRRVRRSGLPSGSNSLDEFVIPDDLKKTLDGSDFLIKDSTIGSERILLFTTISNIRYLSQSLVWLMDGTFDTVPTIFRQLYTIHGSVGGDSNSRILPLVYALMSSKSEICYKRLFQDLVDFSKDHNINLQPEFVLTDFELASINALQN
ncbi:11114_t:CDS:1, partial [Dentiscutata heterogama]